MVGFASTRLHAVFMFGGKKIYNYLNMNACRMNLQCISHYNF